MRFRDFAESWHPQSRRGPLDRSRSAFTLFELLLVCAIMVALGAMIYPSMEGMYNGYKVSASADQVRAAWAQARTHAMEEGRPYRFSVKTGSGDFRVAPDSVQYWAGSDAPQNDDDPANPPLIKVDEISKPIVFRSVDSGSQNPDPLDPTPPQVKTSGGNAGRNEGGWLTIAIFLPDGSAQDDVKISLETAGAKPTTLRLRALTGVVTIHAPTDGDKQ